MRILVPAVALLLATGCEEWERIFMKPAAEDVEDTGSAALGCADIHGTFVADALDFHHEADPAIGEDFGDYPDYTIVFDAPSQTFEAILIRAGEAIVSAGTYGIIGERIVFEHPFVDGMGAGPFAMRCDYDGSTLTLYGPASYSFDGGEPVDTDFIGILLADR